jgi:bifunctional UDP-N-acetylglucosamine pyrophosphorylase/glucosamine-1-phosphate N-acetyltransferase
MLFERLRGGIGIHAIILAAGRGSRMGVLSDSIPKGLIPIAGKTIIARLLEVLVKSGVHSIHIGVGWKGELFKKHLLILADSYPLEVVQVSSLEKGPLHTLSTLLERWDAEPFLICPVDYVVSPIIVKQLIKEHKRGGDSRAVTVSTSLDSRYGSPIYVQSDGRVSGIGTSLIDYDDMHRSAMILAVNSEAIQHFRAAHDSGEKTVVAVLNEMVSKRMDVYATNVDGVWFDIDSISDLLGASNMILNRLVEPAKGCIIVPTGDTIEIGEEIEFPSGTLIESGVSIEGPAFIGPACRIEQNCRIGPGVSMENDTELAREATLERCILFGSAHVSTGAHINDAIVYGRRIIIEESE